MAQVSLPMRIALAATLVIAVGWFMFMRPKNDAVEEPTPAAQTAQPAAGSGVIGAAGKAQAAVGTANAATRAREEAAKAVDPDNSAAVTPSAPADATQPGQPASSENGAAAGDPSAPILASLSKGRVAVVLFWEPDGSDDRAVRRAVRRLSRRGGRVTTHVAPIADVAKYEAITSGVQVLTAPTVLVISPTFQARALTGYTDIREIDQAVGDILDVSGISAQPADLLKGVSRDVKVACKGKGKGCTDFLMQANKSCADAAAGSFQRGLEAGVAGGASGASPQTVLTTVLDREVKTNQTLITTVAAMTPAPALKASHEKALALMRRNQLTAQRVVKELKASPSLSAEQITAMGHRVSTWRVVRSRTRTLERLGYGACA